MASVRLRDMALLAVLLTVAVASSSTPALGASVLASGAQLGPEESLVSPSGTMTLYNNGTGWLSLFSTPTSKPCWRWAQPLAFSYPLLFVPSSNGNRTVSSSNGQTSVQRSFPVNPTHPNPRGSATLRMQADGNLVYARDNGNGLLWDSGTSGNPGAYLSVQDDGNLVVYSSNGRTALWAAGTKGNWKGGRLCPGETLPSGGTLSSANGQWKLSMGADGNLCLSPDGGGKAIWCTNTAGQSGAYLKNQNDGNLVIYKTNGQAAWASSTNNANPVNSGKILHLFDSGTLAILTANGSAAWTPTPFGGWYLYDVPQAQPVMPLGTTLKPGYFVMSWGPIGGGSQQKTLIGPTVALVMQGDGNLVAYCPIVQGTTYPALTAGWASNTVGNPGSYLSVQQDGNLVIYSSSNKPLWTTNTAGHTDNFAFEITRYQTNNYIMQVLAKNPVIQKQLWSASVTGCGQAGWNYPATSVGRPTTKTKTRTKTKTQTTSTTTKRRIKTPTSITKLPTISPKPYNATVPVALGGSACLTGWIVPPKNASAKLSTCGCASPNDPMQNPNPQIKCNWTAGAVPNNQTFSVPSNCITGIGAPQQVNPNANRLVCSCAAINDPGYAYSTCEWPAGYVAPNLNVGKASHCFFPTSAKPNAVTGILKCAPNTAATKLNVTQIGRMLSIQSTWTSRRFWEFVGPQQQAYAAASLQLTSNAYNDLRSLYPSNGLQLGVASVWFSSLTNPAFASLVQKTLQQHSSNCNTSCLKSVLAVLAQEAKALNTIAVTLNSAYYIITSLGGMLESNMAWAATIVATADSNTVTPPSKIKTWGLDLLSDVLQSLSFVDWSVSESDEAGAGFPILLNLIAVGGAQIQASLKTPTPDPYWTGNDQLTQTVAALASVVKSTIGDLQAAVQRRLSAVASNPLLLRMFASTMAVYPLPTTSQVNGFCQYALPKVQAALVRLLFGSKWNLCTTYQYLNLLKEPYNCNGLGVMGSSYIMPTGRFYTIVANTVDAYDEPVNIVGWICPTGAATGGTTVNASVYSSGGVTGTLVGPNSFESSLVNTVWTSRGNPTAQKTTKLGWSVVPWDNCPSS